LNKSRLKGALMKKIWLLIILSSAFSQFLDNSDKAIEKLNSVLEIASRSQQKVFVDDFTGLN
tara:strand:+ start:4852 stop:5037 length:186 start_codon:yes stop_codon:yes gene_type:complete